MKKLLIGLVTLCCGVAASAAIVPDGPTFEIGDTETPESLRVAANGAGGAAIAWNSSSNDLIVQIVDSDGALAGDPVTIGDAFSIELAGHNGHVAVAWHAFGPCGLTVLDEAGAVVFEQRFDQFACELSGQPVSWIDDQRVAFAYGFVDDTVRPWRNVAMVAVADLGHGVISEFQPEAPFSLAPPAIDADDSRILVSLHASGFEIEPLINQVFDLDGAPLGAAFAVPDSVYTDTARTSGFPRLLGNSAVILASRCDGERCGLPALQNYDLGTNTAYTVDAVSSALLNATPSIQFRPAFLDQGPDGSLLARWNIAADPTSEAGLAANIILNPDGNPVLGEHLFQALTDRDLQLEHGVNPEAATGAAVAGDRALLSWADNGHIRARYFHFEPSSVPDDFQAQLNVQTCDAHLAWVDIELHGHLGAVTVRHGGPDGEVVAQVAPDTPRPELLATFGDTFYFFDSASDTLLAVETLDRDITGSCENDRLKLTALSSPDSSGRFTAKVSWSGHSAPVEVRIDNPDGKLFAAGAGQAEEHSTGSWVRDGMLFFLVQKQPGGTTSVSSFAIAKP